MSDFFSMILESVLDRVIAPLNRIERPGIRAVVQIAAMALACAALIGLIFLIALVIKSIRGA